MNYFIIYQESYGLTVSKLGFFNDPQEAVLRAQIRNVNDPFLLNENEFRAFFGSCLNEINKLNSNPVENEPLGA